MLFRSSNQAVKQKVAITKTVQFTPQESEQLSQYVADDTYVQRQKADIQELASLFRDMMGSSEKEDTTEFVEEIRRHFVPQPGFAAGFKVVIEEKKKPLMIVIDGASIDCHYGEGGRVDVEIQLDRTSFSDIVSGRTTFQTSFMAGDMKMKGDFKVLRSLDQVLQFGAG